MLERLGVKCIINDILDINDDAVGAIMLFDDVRFNRELFAGGEGHEVRWGGWVDAMCS